MPPSFIKRISRSSSALVTAGPNHHQRIMMRESSGGFRKERCRSSIGAGRTLRIGARMIATNNTIEAKHFDCDMLLVIGKIIRRLGSSADYADYADLEKRIDWPLRR